jgi:outer membrane receptor protein involved in Fe transport
MNLPPVTRSVRCWSCALASASVLVVAGFAADAAPEQPPQNGRSAAQVTGDRPDQNATEPNNVNPVAKKADVASEEIIPLSPFEVSVSKEDTYDAANTNSVTGTSLSLDKVPLDAKIFNRTIMDDLGVLDVASMLANFSGLGPAILSSGNENQSGLLSGDAHDYKTVMSRGLKISNPRRDGFIRSDTSLMDTYDVESTELVMGSNSLIFGSGDAGGVVNVNSKHGLLNQQFAKFNATYDSEGSTRYTMDINAGAKQFAIRVNALKDNERYFRPVLGLRQEGLQVAPIVKPLNWLTITGEYRHVLRDNINSGNPKNEVVRAPTNLILTDGEKLDNQNARKITGLGGSELINNFITLTNQDSISGAYKRHYYIIEGQAIAVEAKASNNLYFKFVYGQDERTNFSVAPSSSVVYAPDAVGNNYTDPYGNHQWAMNTSPTGTSSQQGSRGSKLTGFYHRDLGRWGEHWLTALISMQNNTSASIPWRYYETDSNGQIIQNPNNINDAQSGRNLMPNAWITPFAEKLFNFYSWPASKIINPANGKTYKPALMRLEGAVTPTVGNPLGISGPLDPKTGSTNGNYTRTMIRERSGAVTLTSELWHGRINTMLGFRKDRADRINFSNGVVSGPIYYNSTTLGAVVNTPITGLRGYVAYATNGNPNFDAGTDIFTETLPVGKGVSKEAGLKLSMWDNRLSGNACYYNSEGMNYAADLGSTRDIVDPNGINGRHSGGSSYSYNMISDGIDLRLSMRPLKEWQITVNYSEANGSERSNVVVPIFYNDEFNTTSVNGQTVVGVQNATTGNVTALMVRSVPSNPSSAQVPLSIAMLKDPNSPYFAVLDPNSGQILNATTLGLSAAGIGTERTGLPIADHQLGFVPPSATIIVRSTGEKTSGFPENSFSIINRYQFAEGRLHGLVLGITTVYTIGFRGYMYTDAAQNKKRRMLYYPDSLENNIFAIYRFKPGRKIRASVQLNVTNLFDKQAVITLPSSTVGTIAAFTYQHEPRRVAMTTTIDF